MSNSSIWSIDRILPGATTSGQSEPVSNINEGDTLHSPQLQHYWGFTIRWFNVIFRILKGGVLPLCRDAVSVFYRLNFTMIRIRWPNLSYIKVKATVVKGDLKTPFSIATTPRCRQGHYSFPGSTPLYPWSLPYNAEC